MHMHARTRTHTHIHARTHTHTCTHTHAYTHAHTRMHARTRIHIHAYTHTNAHTQVTQGMAGLKVNEEVGHGTIKAPPTHDAEADAQVLRRAMKGLGKHPLVGRQSGAWSTSITVNSL